MQEALRPLDTTPNQLYESMVELYKIEENWWKMKDLKIITSKFTKCKNSIKNKFKILYFYNFYI